MRERGRRERETWLGKIRDDSDCRGDSLQARVLFIFSVFQSHSGHSSSCPTKQRQRNVLLCVGKKDKNSNNRRERRELIESYVPEEVERRRTVDGGLEEGSEKGRSGGNLEEGKEGKAAVTADPNDHEMEQFATRILFLPPHLSLFHFHKIKNNPQKIIKIKTYISSKCPDLAHHLLNSALLERGLIIMPK